MLLHTYTLLGISCFLGVPFVLSTIISENGAGSSPLLHDCYAAVDKVPDTDDVVTVIRNSAFPYEAGSFGKPRKCLTRLP